MDFERVVEIFANPVGHSRRGSVRWVECKGFVKLEVRVVYTRMETDVIEFDTVALVLANHDVIAKSHLKSRISCYVRFA